MATDHSPTPPTPPRPAAAAAPLVFHFDFISPYGYFASRQIEAIAARHGRAVDWRPMLLGVSVMKVMGLKPLLDTPLKGDYVERDVRRHQRALGLPMARQPRDPMMNPLPAARAAAWVRAHRPAALAGVVHAIYGAVWGAGQDLSTPASLAPVVGADIADAAGGDEAAALLRALVDEGLRAGVFGSPTVVVDGEPFWGVDRLPDVDRWLATGGW
jgi:2-hydroxychromene-2-carboxylate isomerase